MYINYFTSIKTLLNAQLNTVKKVDWFNNQYQRYENLKATQFPVVYVEFPQPIQWTTDLNKHQRADTEVTFHLVLFDIADAPDKSLMLANDLHKLLQGTALLSDADEQLCSPMMRDLSELELEYDQLKIVKLTYKMTLFDTSAMKQMTEYTITKLDVTEADD